MATRSRRSVLRLFGEAGFGVLALQAVWSTVRFARAPVSYAPPMRRSLGEPGEYAAGTAVYVEDAGVFVLRDANLPRVTYSIGGIRPLVEG